MSPDFIFEASAIILAIVGAAVALGAMLVPGQRAMRQEIGRLGDRMTRLEERMDRLEGWFGGSNPISSCDLTIERDHVLR